MEKTSRAKKMEHDFAVTAFRVVQEATGQTKEAQDKVEAEPQPLEGKNPHAVALGRLGGKKGGKARTEKLSPERRRAISQQAAKARWARRRT